MYLTLINKPTSANLRAIFPDSASSKYIIFINMFLNIYKQNPELIE